MTSTDNRQSADQDPLLTLLVHLANQIGLEAGITLFVRGMVISGDLVGGNTFKEGFIESIRSGSGPAARPLAAGLQPVLEIAYPDPTDKDPVPGGDEPDHDEDEARRIVFVHLRSAEIQQSGSTPLPAPWWRGRLAHVDGWTLGRISTT